MNTGYTMTNEEYQEFEDYATIDNAREWLESPEKYTYCLEFLDLSAWDENADSMINRIEIHFEYLLEDTVAIA